MCKSTKKMCDVQDILYNLWKVKMSPSDVMNTHIQAIEGEEMN